MPKTNNRALNNVSIAQNDEFYTQYGDIHAEMNHYRPHFAGKVVYCNCDDPRASNFFHYFSHAFEKLHLKKLITTCYQNKSRDIFSQHNVEKAVYLEYRGDKNDNRVPDPEEIGVHHLQGDGDFRSEECIELLKQASLVVTNPPFSKFREYFAQLVEYDKKFIILGNMNAISYKEVFPLIKENKVWLGVNNGAKEFNMPSHAENFNEVRNEQKIMKMGNVVWYTNIDHEVRNEPYRLTELYAGGGGIS